MLQKEVLENQSTNKSQPTNRDSYQPNPQFAEVLGERHSLVIAA